MLDVNTIKKLLQAGVEQMTESQIADAISHRFQIFGGFKVIRACNGASSGSGRSFSKKCTVYLIGADGWLGKQVSPKSGWTIEQAARFIYGNLNRQKAVEETAPAAAQQATTSVKYLGTNHFGLHEFSVESSTTPQVMTVRANHLGWLNCSCPDYRFRKVCRHLAFVRDAIIDGVMDSERFEEAA
jgi:hypothetical protein